MHRNEPGEITAMDWDLFEERLHSSVEKAFVDYFGKEEYDWLQKLSAHSRKVSEQLPASGNVVIVPGIMGSDLAVKRDDGGIEPLWIDFPSLVTGGVDMLALPSDVVADTCRNNGTSAIIPIGVNKRIYARVVLRLRASWNVATFAYDWRKDIVAAADALAGFIDEHFHRKPVHLVAHSMGGLVSRMFIVRHPELWESMRGGIEGVSGGRLIMFGTPNYGSFVIPQILTGEDMTARLLAAADLKNRLQEVLGIISTFAGFYQMLPFQSRLSPAQQMIYRPDSWGDAPVSLFLLNRSPEFHNVMDHPESIDSHRMIYIAGCNRKTPSGISINAPGDFDYRFTWDGDGFVTHELGLLPGVPAYYVVESHGELLRNEKVLNALNDLLICGRTEVLSERPMVSRAVGQPSFLRRSLIAERVVSTEISDIAKRVVAGNDNRQDIRFAEESILRSAMGTPFAGMDRSSGKTEIHKGMEIALAVELVQGDVTTLSTPVIVIGHYRGVPPLNAEGAINHALHGMITLANDQGMIGAGLGELFFIPVTGKQIRAGSVILAGMGEEGRFTKDDLRYLMTNVTLAVSALRLDSFAMVVVGSGKGNLSKERAIVSIIEGVADALRRFSEVMRVRKLVIVERYDEEYSEIKKILCRLQAERERIFPCLDLTFTYSRRRSAERKKKSHVTEITLNADEGDLSGARITVERNIEESHDTFTFSALSNTAVIPVRKVEVQDFFLRRTSDRLMVASTLQEQSEYGQLLATYLFPEDFRRIVDKDESLTLMLDRSTASYPWEMACFKNSRQQIFLGSDLQLTRQFRSMLASPGLMPPLNRKLNVLVIADPAPERELQLEAARREGRTVVDILRGFSEVLDITLHERIGAAACDPVEILALLCNVEYDIVHYAGHGVFDEKSPARSGWLFSRECILSPREIFQLRRVPRLVFANACFSAVIEDRSAMDADEENRRLAGLAESFFGRGIQNYIGTGWAVDDKAAECFARVFYSNALGGETLGYSMAEARKGIFGQGSTWGAYQHYGHVNAHLVCKP